MESYYKCVFLILHKFEDPIITAIIHDKLSMFKYFIKWKSSENCCLCDAIKKYSESLCMPNWIFMYHERYIVMDITLFKCLTCYYNLSIFHDTEIYFPTLKNGRSGQRHYCFSANYQK